MGTGNNAVHLLVSLAAQKFGLNPYWLLLRSNPREFNFILSCTTVLQKYDAERSESDRKWQAAMWGVELKDDPTKAHKPPSSNRRKQTMTQQDIMRNYGSKSGGGKGGSGSGIQ